MIILREKKKPLKESEFWTLEEFEAKIPAFRFKSITMNCNQMVFSIDRLPSPTLQISSGKDVLVLYCGSIDIRIENRSITAIERTSGCVVVATNKKQILWLKF